MPQEYISTKEAAEKWNTKEWRVIKGCETGQIPEAAKYNDQWLIPVDLEKPTLKFKREPKEKTYAHGSAYKDTIFNMTMQGFPNFDVSVYEIGGTKYEVYTCFSANAKETLRTIIYRMAVREYNEENKGVSSINEKAFMDEVIKDEEAKMPSKEELRKYYCDKFIEIGFNEDDMDILMSKIDEHIEKRYNG